MGSKKSKPDDEQHLLGDTDDEITVLFDKIKIVLIGCQKAGKNKIGNAILGKNAFTYLNTRKEHYLKDDNTIFGRRITLIRVPGWSQDLSSDDIKQFKIQQVIKDSVKSFKDGPHAILLVVKRNTTLTETTRETLEKLLGSNVSEHMLVFSIDGAKISFATMIDHCAERRQTTIDRCKKRYHLFRRCMCGKQNMELIEIIEDFIMKKKAINFHSTGKEQPKPERQVQQLATLVNRLKQRISDLSEYISKLQSRNQTETSKLRRTIELKNEEIRNLQAVLRQKEEALREMKEATERLRSNQSTTEMSALHERITQLENEGREREKELQKMLEENEQKKAEIRTLKEENQELKDILCVQERKKRQIQRRMTNGTEAESFELYVLLPTGAEFVDSNRKELIKRVVSVDPILDELYQFIGDDKYSQIRLAKTNPDKMRELYTILDGAGQMLKAEFYNSLLNHEKCLVEDLCYRGNPQPTSAP
ncbi:GTPase IMAP family member 9-like isoform X2 [Pygocentrus nattereri]|uniref:GTPase IMAP family member 9-like isoform X2 n=1 Tax=Pygocentrus nattereri TaxID=42514 RepID=UPI001890F951|nr:GTPase IMAP family member 9-like isoform X2 [Pygocentrus nattereri]